MKVIAKIDGENRYRVGLANYSQGLGMEKLVGAPSAAMAKILYYHMFKTDFVGCRAQGCGIDEYADMYRVTSDDIVDLWNSKGELN